MTAIAGPPWTKAEDAAIVATYRAGGIDAARAALPSRSLPALYHRAKRLDLCRRRRWTEIDDARLRKLWTGELSLREVALALRRTECTTYWRAQKLGLPLGVPPGWERLHHAAERTGFGTGQLRRILADAGVGVRPVLARPSARRGRRVGTRNHFGMVWPADVDAAVADWLERESVEAHARRLGVSRETLKRRLARLGGKAPRGKRHWRVTEEQARRALGAKLVRTRAGGRYTGARFEAAS